MARTPTFVPKQGELYEQDCTNCAAPYYFCSSNAYRVGLCLGCAANYIVELQDRIREILMNTTENDHEK